MAAEVNIALDVTMSDNVNVPILELTGRIIDVDVKKFQRKIDQLYKKNYPKIILDLSKANFIDSHGLGTIVYYHTLMQKEKHALVIVNQNSDKNSYLNRLFEMTNLDKVLNVVSSLDLAMIQK